MGRRQNQEFDDILDECLKRLLTQGETLEQCLASYPKVVNELKPLLETALAAKQASAIEPRPEFKARARYEFRSALQGVKPKRRLPFLEWWPRWATVAVIVALVLLLSGGSTVAAAANSMPDEILYTVKMASEEAQLLLTPSSLGKAELYASLADKRVSEIVYVANKGDAEQVALTSQRLNKILARIAALVSMPRATYDVTIRTPVPTPTPALAPDESGETSNGASMESDSRAGLRQTLAIYAIDHPARLRAALQEAPESARPALRQAIASLVINYAEAIRATES